MLLFQVVSVSSFSHFGCNAKQNQEEYKQQTRRAKQNKRHIQRIIFALKNCCTKVIEEITRRQATMVTTHTHTHREKRRREEKNHQNSMQKEINAHC